MDKKKKIIIIIGSIVFITALSVFIRFMLFSSKESKTERDAIHINTPEVDDQKIPHQSKIKNYNQEDSKKYENNEIIKNIGENQNLEKDSTEYEKPFIESNLTKILNQNKTIASPSKTSEQERNMKNEQEAVNAELKELMRLQNELANPSLQYPNESMQNEILLNNLYSQYGLSPEEIKEIENIEKRNSLKAQGEVPEKDIKKTPKPTKSIEKKQNHFQGAGAINNTTNVFQLIPAETVDQGVVVNGSTIAIRTKKSITINTPKVIIPKGAIVYGKVKISTDRLLVDIESYTSNEKLYKLDISLYDFDGREGIHVGNRTWPKIPSKVAKDVYDYAYQKGTQASTFGSQDTGINLNESKDIAILSSAKHIGEEVFEKRKIFIPRKYHLWFNINNL